MKYDVTILGAGPAGTAAAQLLCARGLKPVVIEQAAKPGRKHHRPEWISAAAVQMLAACGIDCTSILGAPFGGVTFHSADLKKTAASASADPPGYRLDYEQLLEHMHQAARDAGGPIIYAAEPSRIEPGEKGVRLDLAGRETIESSFMLLADGAARTFATVGQGQPPPVVAAPSPKANGRWMATLEVSPAGKARESAARTGTTGKRSLSGDTADQHMHWLLGADRQQAIVLWWWNGLTLVMSALASGTAESTVKLLCSTAGRLADAGLIAIGGGVDPSVTVVRPAPARCALEIDTHVEKRSLLIGDAGGFVSETSGEGIYPAVWSAQLAVDTITTALAGAHPQDQLRQFSTTWRSTMAEYLRPPNTDVHFLLPLIFSNQQMADRMAAAFWQGTNI